VVVHPGSFVHSCVVFRDGAMLAQLGSPDMRLPLLYALAGEKRWPLAAERLDLLRIGTLRFEPPDLERFACLRLALDAGRSGGTAPIALNAANEVAVAALLAGRLRYADIATIVGDTLAALPQGTVADVAEVLAVDAEALDSEELKPRPHPLCGCEV
jgi:1-deoxy-D-xylulose-5-phosphate reductoisomerase